MRERGLTDACRVFADLWHRGMPAPHHARHSTAVISMLSVHAICIVLGYYVTAGAKFGGDYLVYPGARTHHPTVRNALCKSNLLS